MRQLQAPSRLPARPGCMASLDPSGKDGWTSPAPAARGRTYRLCDNYSKQNVCNWTVLEADPNRLCQSCRLTRTIPALSVPENHERWHRLEVAKRRLVYTLLCLGLSLTGKAKNHKDGLVFEFLADPEVPGAAPVLTGHNDGPSRSTWPRPTTPSGRNDGRRCTSRTEPSRGTFAMRSAIITGTC